jgi:F-type H+-transporting ATPase subunit gamma
MPSLKDIRIRIDSTKNTQQITKAMKLVSAAKLRKAQNRVTSLRPYANTLVKLIADIAATERVSHPLLMASKNSEKVLLVVLTSDRGLCGGFNSQIIRFAENFINENKLKYKKLDLMFIGRKAADYFSRKGFHAIENITKLDREISYDLSSSVAEKMMKNYLSGEYQEIKLIYNEFKSAISQKPVIETMLPVDLSKQSIHEEETAKLPFSKDMIFNPNPEEIIEELLNRHFSVQVYRCMSESVAAEHGARMSAMENATNNAKEVISKLTLTYNKLRQEKITTELTEIVSGAEALK